MSKKKALTDQELEYIAEQMSEVSDYSYFDDSDEDPNYAESSFDDDSSESESSVIPRKRRKLDYQLEILSRSDLEDNLAGPSLVQTVNEEHLVDKNVGGKFEYKQICFTLFEIKYFRSNGR